MGNLASASSKNHSHYYSNKFRKLERNRDKIVINLSTNFGRKCLSPGPNTQCGRSEHVKRQWGCRVANETSFGDGVESIGSTSVSSISASPQDSGRCSVRCNCACCCCCMPRLVSLPFAPIISCSATALLAEYCHYIT